MQCNYLTFYVYILTSSLRKKMKKLEEVQKVDRVKERDFFLKNVSNIYSDFIIDDKRFWTCAFKVDLLF